MMKTATLRLKRDYCRLIKDPIPYVITHPLHENILEWHYVVIGAPGTPFEDGYYHGKLIFPHEFPFKPPAIFMLTPNGRFKTNTRLCLSISDYHPETWNPTWSAGAILMGLQSFMSERTPTLGSIVTTDQEKRDLAEQSLEFNLNDKTFCELFPTIAESCRAAIRDRNIEKERNELESFVPGALASGVNQGVALSSRFELHQQVFSFVTNIVVILGFAAFAFVVKYVITMNGPEST